MTTRDTFLDALTIPTARPPTRRASSPPNQPERAAKPVSLPPKINPRPDFADDIDRIVAAMIDAGQVVFDPETETFKRPAVRRWRFSKVG